MNEFGRDREQFFREIVLTKWYKFKRCEQDSHIRVCRQNELEVLLGKDGLSIEDAHEKFNEVNKSIIEVDPPTNINEETEDEDEEIIQTQTTGIPPTQESPVVTISNSYQRHKLWNMLKY
eukprot:GHVR01023195.1.p1 GENE.GHVR01023195.1~~GHVR01023195.1.p1  ORF type:complete len:120 (+),score=18.47 GHVR01023195.1:73-432(+)